ncbi:hypothetical protein A2U01_0001758 [Trifolium medium]|uniref:Uncharacterized protein n=1 Tax=Trifolium medium TaxID=97028 RepID=A0A392M105_9FABA|nr:hypothetical protein [Trifolium medium]
MESSSASPNQNSFDLALIGTPGNLIEAVENFVPSFEEDLKYGIDPSGCKKRKGSEELERKSAKKVKAVEKSSEDISLEASEIKSREKNIKKKLEGNLPDIISSNSEEARLNPSKGITKLHQTISPNIVSSVISSAACVLTENSPSSDSSINQFFLLENPQPDHLKLSDGKVSQAVLNPSQITSPLTCDKLMISENVLDQALFNE